MRTLYEYCKSYIYIYIYKDKQEYFFCVIHFLIVFSNFQLLVILRRKVKKKSFFRKFLRVHWKLFFGFQVSSTDLQISVSQDYWQMSCSYRRYILSFKKSTDNIFLSINDLFWPWNVYINLKEKRKTSLSRWLNIFYCASFPINFLAVGTLNLQISF